MTERREMPERRRNARTKVTVGGFTGYIEVGYYDDGSPGDIFIDTSKQGSELRGLYAALSHSVSVGLQYGVPMEEFVGAFTHTRFGPNGPIRNAPELGDATSPLDALFRVAAAECGLDIPPPRPPL